MKNNHCDCTKNNAHKPTQNGVAVYWISITTMTHLQMLYIVVLSLMVLWQQMN